MFFFHELRRALGNNFYIFFYVLPRHPFLHHTEEELIELFQTNVVGPMLLTQKFLTRDRDYKQTTTNVHQSV